MLAWQQQTGFKTKKFIKYPTFRGQTQEQLYSCFERSCFFLSFLEDCEVQVGKLRVSSEFETLETHCRVKRTVMQSLPTSHPQNGSSWLAYLQTLPYRLTSTVI